LASAADDGPSAAGTTASGFPAVDLRAIDRLVAPWILAQTVPPLEVALERAKARLAAAPSRFPGR
jgi:hypothetical protein